MVTESLSSAFRTDFTSDLPPTTIRLHIKGTGMDGVCERHKIHSTVHCTYLKLSSL